MRTCPCCGFEWNPAESNGSHDCTCVLREEIERLRSEKPSVDEAVTEVISEHARPHGEYSLRAVVHSHHIDFTATRDEEVEFHGFVKWDGCSNWGADQMIHFCEREDITAFSAALLACFDWVKELRPDFELK